MQAYHNQQQGCAAWELTGDSSTWLVLQVVLYESEVINEWLDEEFPHPPMLPQQPLARAQVGSAQP